MKNDEVEAVTEAIRSNVLIGQIANHKGRAVDEVVGIEYAAHAAIAVIDDMRGAGWLPIDSAPKDGTHILVAGRWLGSNTVCIDMTWWGTKWGQTNEDAERDWQAGWGNKLSQVNAHFTHWMPLPPPPEQSQ